MCRGLGVRNVPNQIESKSVLENPGSFSGQCESPCSYYVYSYVFCLGQLTKIEIFVEEMEWTSQMQYHFDQLFLPHFEFLNVCRVFLLHP